VDSAEPGSGNSQRLNCSVLIVTVHGTWAGAAAWTKQDSKLGQAVLQRYREQGREATVLPFKWSGRNSVAARAKAGRALADLLVDLRRESTPRAIYLIAHSHGGSVFAYALKQEPRLTEQIDGFIALATPWIDVAVCGYIHQLRAFLSRTVLYICAASTLIPLGHIVDRLVPLLRPSDSWEALADSIIYYYLGGALVGVIFYLLSRRLRTWLVWTSAIFQLRTEELARRASTLHERFPPSIFLKPVRDEAALALAFTSAMASLTQAASQLLFVLFQSIHDWWFAVPRATRISAAVLAAILCFTGTVSFSMELSEWPMRIVVSHLMDRLFHDTFERLTFAKTFDPFAVLNDLSQWSAFIIWVAGTVLSAGLASIAAVALLAAAGAGLPTLTAGLYFQMSVEVIPEGSYQLVLVETRKAVPQLEHISTDHLSHTGLYDSPDAVAVVLRALDAFEQAATIGLV
jgi:hypothetical protein